MFVCDDFVTCKALYQVQYDYFYSRWTIHAVSRKQEWELIKNVSSAIKKKGIIFYFVFQYICEHSLLRTSNRS